MRAVRLVPAQNRTEWGSDQTRALEDGLRELQLAATPDQTAKLRRYGDLLLKWNRTYNLLGATTASAMVEQHLLDSLAVVPALGRWLSPGMSAMADVGTGAGLPGVVLAIMLPGLPITLIEPVGKKAAFLRQATAECQLQGVQVMEARIEDVQPPGLARSSARSTGNATGVRQHFICRAFTFLDRFATLCSPHLRDGSLMFAMKAAKVPEELLDLSSAIEVLAVEPLCTVDKDVQRNLVVMRSRESHPASDPTEPAP